LGIYLEIALIFIEESGKEIKVIALNLGQGPPLLIGTEALVN